MPTMRQVAVALKIDLNTVRHAYDELERIGAITLASLGAAASSRQNPARVPDRFRDSDGLAKQVLATAASMGLDPVAVADRITALAKQKE